jgi:DNA-binding NarL/FixJ family response regulator
MPEQQQIRVMIVDAHRIVLSGLKRLIDDEKPRMEVVATASQRDSALELVEKTHPHVILLDVGLLEESAPQFVMDLVNGSDRRVLILGATKGNHHELAILHGACGVVRKDESPEILLKAISKVHDGQLWLDRSTTGRLFVELSRRTSLVQDPDRRKIESLTSREQDVVRTLVTRPGADNKTLASSLHIGEHTLRNHLSRIYDKLGVPNRVELYVFAQRLGLNGQSEKR